MPDTCEHWNGLIAEAALRPLERNDASALHAHLAACADCRALADEFAATAATLTHARPEHLEPTTTPAAAATSSSVFSEAPTADVVYDRVATRLVAERANRRRRWTMAIVATAAAALISVLVVSTTTSRPAPIAGPRVALVTETVDGAATLEPRPWGTQIHLQANGFHAGQRYIVWLEQADGTHVPAGTFTGVAATRITVTLASAIDETDAVAIGISSPDGTLIVRSPVD